MMELIDELISALPSKDEEAIKSLIERTQDFELYPNKDQIWASILILSDGSLDEVIEILPHAKKDWRDVVVAAGLAVDEWKRVAESWLSQRVNDFDSRPSR